MTIHVKDIHAIHFDRRRVQKARSFSTSVPVRIDVYMIDERRTVSHHGRMHVGELCTLLLDWRRADFQRCIDSLKGV